MSKVDSIIVPVQSKRNSDGSIQITFLLKKNISKMITYESCEKATHFIDDVPAGSLIAFLENNEPQKGYEGYHIMLFADVNTNDICIVYNGNCEVDEERIKEAFFRKIILEYNSKKILQN